MGNFMRNVTSAYKIALKEMKADTIASAVNYKPMKTPAFNTDRKSGARTSIKAYGTSRDARERKAKRSKSVGGF